LQKTVRIFRVAGLGTRRGPASEAQLLYEDLTPPPPKRNSPEQVSWGERAAGSGRPTKRDRRVMDEFKGKT
jgi:ribosome-associated heat shock protein Hsp15